MLSDQLEEELDERLCDELEELELLDQSCE